MTGLETVHGKKINCYGTLTCNLISPIIFTTNFFSNSFLILQCFVFHHSQFIFHPAHATDGEL